MFEIFSLGKSVALLPSALPGFRCVPCRSGAEPPFYFCKRGGGWEEVDLLVGVGVGGGLFVRLSRGLGPQGFDVTQVFGWFGGWGSRFEELSAVERNGLCAWVSGQWSCVARWALLAEEQTDSVQGSFLRVAHC